MHNLEYKQYNLLDKSCFKLNFHVSYVQFKCKPKSEHVNVDVGFDFLSQLRGSLSLRDSTQETGPVYRSGDRAFKIRTRQKKIPQQ